MSADGVAARYFRESLSGQWTDNAARVAAVVRRHPEVTVEWPSLPADGFRASWPAEPGEEGAKVILNADSAGELADALEQRFPAGNDGG